MDMKHRQHASGPHNGYDTVCGYRYGEWGIKCNNELQEKLGMVPVSR